MLKPTEISASDLEQADAIIQQMPRDQLMEMEKTNAPTVYLELVRRAKEVNSRNHEKALVLMRMAARTRLLVKV